MNFIQWNDWNSQAFKTAANQKKPVLLSISATWCHWCHRLDHDTLEKPSVVELVNEKFIPIRIDTDQRPDINARYNAGGWPTVAILDANGIPLTAGTYFPEKEFLAWLNQGLTAFSELKNQSPHRHWNPSENAADFSSFELLTDDFTQLQVHAIETVKQNFDVEYKGFGAQPKFPHIEALEFLIFSLWENQNPDLSHMLFSTLDAMASKGLWDKEEKGFFRYCTTREWSNPHFEKMLEDNVQLAKIFLDAHHLSQGGNSDYKKTVIEIFDYLEKNLLDSKTNSFFGSQDADEEYYRLTLEERKKNTAPSVDKTVFSDWNTMAAIAYFRAFELLENKKYFQIAGQIISYLTKERMDETGGIFHSEKTRKINTENSQLFFFKDCVWFIKANLQAYQITFAPKFLENAQKTADFCLENFWDAKNKGFWDKTTGPDSVGLLNFPLKNLPENLLMAECLLKLSFFKKNQVYHKTAMQTFQAFLATFESQGLQGALFGQTAVLLRDGLSETRLVSRMDEEAKIWQFAFLKKAFAKNAMSFVVADSMDGKELVGEKPRHLPTAFICKKNVCLAPITDLSAFKKAV